MNLKQKIEEPAMMGIKPPEISVIIPFYNVEKYLYECLESVLNQTLKNFELLLVDDGSKDNSLSICREFEKRDSRISVIHQENAGVSAARNAGLEKACGKFVVFIDADDYVGVNYLSDLLVESEKCKPDTLILSDFQNVTTREPEPRNYPEAFTVDLESENNNPDYFRWLVWDFRIYGPYCKLYMTKIIRDNKIIFDTSLKSAEDFDFNMHYIACVKQIRYIPSKEYFYRVGYKKYVPSNHGVIGQSEIKAAHIMADGIINLAERMGLKDSLTDEIARWAAKKHYENRIPMVFAENPHIGYQERKDLFKQLTSNTNYYGYACKGRKDLPSGVTKEFALHADCFLAWWMLYKYRKFRYRKI